MLPYKRLELLLQYFIGKQTCITSEELSEYLQISDRTLRSDISTVNNIISAYGAYFQKDRGKGYRLIVEDGERYTSFIEDVLDRENDYLDSLNQRIHYLIIDMLYQNTFLSIQELADSIYVGTNTIASYLKTMKEILQQYNLELINKANIGYKIIGTEENKRNCILDLISTDEVSQTIMFTSIQKKLFKDIDLDAIKTLVLEYSQNHNLHFSDYNLKNLILHIALTVSRILVNEPIVSNVYGTQYTVDNNEISINDLFSELEQTFHIEIPIAEREYVYAHFVSNTSDLIDPEKNIVYVKTIVVKILNVINETYNFDLRDDKILFQDLMHHFQAILAAKHRELNRKNPLLETIKMNYLLSFEISETAIMETMQNEPYQLTENEIAYISLHIGAAIERFYSIHNVSQKRVLLVFDSGYATGSFMEAKLTNLFKDKIKVVKRIAYNEYLKNNEYDIDFVISTIPILDSEKPVVVVDLSLLTKDVENISKALTLNLYKRMEQVQHFFSSELFLHESQPYTKEEIIHKLSELLLEREIVKNSFEESVLEREEKVSTAIDKVVALPHPFKASAYESKVAIAILDHPIDWSKGAEVRIVLLLALSADAMPNMEYLYDVFIQIMSSQKIQKLLFECYSLQEFMKVLYANIHLDEL